MATAGHNLSDFNPEELPKATGMRIACVVSEWNSEITNALYQGARDILMACGAAGHYVTQLKVPGAVEITYAAKKLCESGKYDAIIGGLAITKAREKVVNFRAYGT